MKHYKYGGSSAERTMHCPPWQGLAAKLPKGPPSSYADHGSMLHDCMEEIVLTDAEPEEFLGWRWTSEEGVVYTVSDDDVTLLDYAYDDYRELIEQFFPDGVQGWEAEQTMELSALIGGTADLSLWGDGTVVIGDWKFGSGIQVKAEKSAQGLFYLMLLWKTRPELFKKIKKIVVAIIQPTGDYGDTLRIWETDMKELALFSQAHEVAVETAEKNVYPVPPKTGPWCKFCPAASVCPAKTGMARKAKLLDPKSKDHKTVSEALTLAYDLEDWAKAVKKFAHEQMEEGTAFKGFKLVNKRATRKWRDDEATLKKVRLAKKLKLEDCTVTKLKSPTQIEKVCKKKDVDFDMFEDHYSAVSSGTTLVRDTDKRPAAVSGNALKALKDKLT